MRLLKPPHGPMLRGRHSSPVAASPLLSHLGPDAACLLAVRLPLYGARKASRRRAFFSLFIFFLTSRPSPLLTTTDAACLLMLVSHPFFPRIPSLFLVFFLFVHFASFPHTVRLRGCDCPSPLQTFGSLSFSVCSILPE